MSAALPLAHAGHVLADLGLYFGPVLTLALALALHTLHARRAADTPNPGQGSQ